ncbi:MAG: thiol:disulfide interchange protein [Flavobacteriia bacterium]|nr:MAG: thiol:disulfide interchange protein [Flavobacteriia bacterium]
MRKIFTTSILFLFFSTLLFAQDLPNIKLKDIDGQSIDLVSYSKDKTIVYSFWATWCVPCINELNAIAEEYDDLKDELKFELIAVSTDDARTASRVKPMVNGKGWEYRVLLDSNQEFKRSMNISTVPFIMIVKDGKIVYSHSGYTPGGEEELYHKLEELL